MLADCDGMEAFLSMCVNGMLYDSLDFVAGRCRLTWRQVIVDVIEEGAVPVCLCTMKLSKVHGVHGSFALCRIHSHATYTTLTKCTLASYGFLCFSMVAFYYSP